jgi:hypothetical protein
MITANGQRYGRDGERNVRRRAVEGTHRLEQGIAVLERQLSAVRWIGRTLRLRYHRRDQRYEFRHREDHGREWPVIGARVPDGIRGRLWLRTRTELDAIERKLDMRQEGRAVLHLVGWLLSHGLAWRTPLVEVVWEDREEHGRLTSTFRMDGRLQRNGNADASLAARGRYGKDGEALRAMIDVRQPLGVYARNVEVDFVGRLERIDRRLAELGDLLRAQRSGLRLYPLRQLDTWSFRHVQWRRGTTHLRIADVDEYAKRLPAQQRSHVVEGLELLEARAGVRRMLRVVAEVTEAAWLWPGGTWKVRGYGGERGTAWAAAANIRGVIGRGYPQESAETCRQREAADEDEADADVE